MARIDRINEEVRSELAKLLPSLKDPRLSGGLVSITRVDTTSDLSRATVYFSVLGCDPKEVGKGLRSASGFLRRELAHNMQLRQTPELNFAHDLSIERGNHILEVMKQVESEISDKPEDSDGE